MIDIIDENDLIRDEIDDDEDASIVIDSVPDDLIDGKGDDE